MKTTRVREAILDLFPMRFFLHVIYHPSCFPRCLFFFSLVLKSSLIMTVLVGRARQMGWWAFCSSKKHYSSIGREEDRVSLKLEPKGPIVH